jgi:hypothetical protein
MFLMVHKILVWFDLVVTALSQLKKMLVVNFHRPVKSMLLNSQLLCYSIAEFELTAIFPK